VKEAGKYLVEGEDFFRSSGLIEVPDERGLLRTTRAQVKFFLFKHRAELATVRDDAWWAMRRQERESRRQDVEFVATDLRAGCKPEAYTGMAFFKEEGDQAFMEAEEFVKQSKWAEARAALKVTEEKWGMSGMLGFPGRPFEAAIEELLAKCDAAQGVKSPPVGGGGGGEGGGKVNAAAAASQTAYAKNKKPWDM